jgi:hypothetical protein
MRFLLYIWLTLALLAACKKDEDGERNRMRYTVEGRFFKDIDFEPYPNYPLKLELVSQKGLERDYKTLDRCVTGKNGSYKFNYISRMNNDAVIQISTDYDNYTGNAISGPFVKDLELNKNIELDFTYNRGAFAIVYLTIKTQKTFTDSDTLYIAQPINSDASIPFPVKTHIAPKNNDTIHLFLTTFKASVDNYKEKALFQYGLGKEDANNAYYFKFQDSIYSYNTVRLEVPQLMKPIPIEIELK